MYCTSCGSELPPDAGWCPRCGARVAPVSASPSASPNPDGADRRRLWVVLTIVFLAIIGLGVWAAFFLFDTADHGSGEAAPQALRTLQSTQSAAAPSSSTAPSAGAGSEDFGAVFGDVSSGVVRVRATTCDGSGAGSGFLIAGDQVATAAHVVNGAVAVAVQNGAETFTARVTGIDTRHDLAVLELDGPVSGHIFSLAADDPQPGTRVAAIGYPLDGALSISVGSVSGLDRLGELDATEVEGLLQTDVAINPGNSGGPLLDLDGAVVGVVSAIHPNAQGISYAVEASTVQPRLANSESMRQPTAGMCTLPLGPEDPEAAGLPDNSSLAEGVARTFATYFDGINIGDYEAAWRQLSPRLQSRVSLNEFSRGVSTSYDFAFNVRDATISSSRAKVWLEFISVQDPEFGPDGEDCTVWSLDYALIPDVSGHYRIDQASGHGGTSGHMPCS